MFKITMFHKGNNSNLTTDQQAFYDNLPAATKKLADEFPYGSYFDTTICRDQRYFILGYAKGSEGVLMISAVDPRENRQEAVNRMVPVHVQCLREALQKDLFKEELPDGQG